MANCALIIPDFRVVGVIGTGNEVHVSDFFDSGPSRPRVALLDLPQPEEWRGPGECVASHATRAACSSCRDHVCGRGLHFGFINRTLSAILAPHGRAPAY